MPTPNEAPGYKPWQGWPYDPYDWQAEVRPKAIDAITSGDAALVSAVMGAGKSAVIAELCASLELGDHEHIVVTTPTIDLVHQLYEDIADRIHRRHIGKFYTDAKQNDRPIIVACMPSAPALGEAMAGAGRDAALWIADEAHKTECDTIHEAFEALEPAARLGFTATPFRASDREELSLWDRLIYEYAPADAMDDGVVVPPKLRTYHGPADTVDTACVEMIDRAVREGEGPGMVNALTTHGSDKINSIGAEAFAQRLEDSGIRADTVHSKKSQDQNDRAIARLKDGKLDCIVHVNKLAEGSNFPWLRWLCMRRPVTSRTRFCQEVGRVLRPHPGKEYGLLLDPNDLFSEFGLSYEAVLAGGASEPDRPDKEAASEVDDVLDDLMQSQADEDKTANGTPVRVLEPTRAWLRKTKLALQSVGAIESKIKSTHWRADPASPKQINLLGKISGLVSRLPGEHERAAKASLRVAELGDLTKGEVSDLISILMAVSDNGWPIEADNLIDRRDVS